ncbi:glutaredoxin family protein [Alkalicoccus saliphilus]|jgi:thiol-disulfide isomerase/thioredoxin|uniref:Glutaredoxin n=1 Tax=Alkalicoccus saliphilus TaxID=200989 RepID=A0A2T4U648_9BACI|nr:glutaredoxin family protein [Alkalicoccus saliphilus]PTL38871.1 hypothetical protein C6Y45_08750 [Alkalicoccus saliphilus]
MKVYFYTKEHCPLCDKAFEKLKMVQEEMPLEIEVYDIYKREDLLEKYQIRIPVVESDAGKVIEEGIVTYGGLISGLKEN